MLRRDAYVYVYIYQVHDKICLQKEWSFEGS